MFGINVFFSMLFVKCKTRGEQVIVVVGMLILVAACFGVGKFFLGMGNASMQSAMDISSSQDTPSGMDRDIAHISLYGYATVAVCAGLGIIFATMATINLVRLITGTGLAADDGWS